MMILAIGDVWLVIDIIGVTWPMKMSGWLKPA